MSGPCTRVGSRTSAADTALLCCQCEEQPVPPSMGRVMYGTACAWSSLVTKRHLSMCHDCAGASFEACFTQLACGHWCAGVNGESAHLGCLVPGCRSYRLLSSSTVEALAQAHGTGATEEGPTTAVLDEDGETPVPVEHDGDQTGVEGSECSDKKQFVYVAATSPLHCITQTPTTPVGDFLPKI